MPVPRLLVVAWCLSLVPRVWAQPVFTTQPTVLAPAGRQVTVTWRTDVDATSEIAWRPADGGVVPFASYPNIDAPAASVGRQHSRTLRLLTPGAWQLKVRSSTGANAVESSDLTVTVPFSERFPLVNVALDARGNALATNAGTLYVGGSFTRAWALHGSGVLTQLATGAVTFQQHPDVAGEVRAVVRDATDTGFYLCGAFGWVGGVQQRGVARLLRDGSLDTTFTVQVDGAVEDCQLAGNTLYLVGTFTAVGGVARNNAAAIDTVGNSVLPWNPNLNAQGLAVAAGASSVYVGGEFTAVNGNQLRARLAAFDPASGAVQPFQADANAPVRALLLDGVNGRLFVGGAFTSSGGSLRPLLSSLDPTTGAVQSFNAGLSGTEVNALQLEGPSLFVGGLFSAGGIANLAVFDAASGAALPGAPACNGQVRRLRKVGTQLFIGGSFTSLGGQGRRGAGAVDGSGVVLPWNPDVSGPVRAIETLPSSTAVYIGGAFAGVGSSVAASGLARVSLLDGAVPPLPLTLSGTVFGLAAGVDQLFVTGFFSTSGAQVRSNAASVYFSPLGLGPFAPQVNQSIHGLALSPDGRVFIGGDFTSIGGTPRNFAAALGTDGSVDLSWDVAPDNSVETLEVHGDVVYLGGTFTQVAGQGRGRVALVDLAGNLYPPVAAVNSTVYAFGPTPDVLYLGGTLSSLNGVARGNAGAVRIDGGVLRWNPQANGPVYTLMPFTNGTVLVGGSFTSPQVALAVVDADGGAALPARDFGIRAPATVRAVALDCSVAGAPRLAVTGSFLNVGAAAAQGVALLDGTPWCGATFDGGGFVFSPDAGRPDAGVLDAGGADAGGSDAGGSDAGGSDAGGSDAGALDGGASDAGELDGGADGGEGDAGVDAGADDAGEVVDAGRGRRVLAAGCGCSEAPPPALLVLALGWLSRGRRRSATSAPCGAQRRGG